VSTTALELCATLQTATQTRALISLGDKPLAVVSAVTQEPEWLDLQDDLATLSSNSRHRVVEGATHTSVRRSERRAGEELGHHRGGGRRAKRPVARPLTALSLYT